MKFNSNLEVITFSSEERRQAHASVKCLPYTVWHSWELFFKQIPRAFIDIMQAPDFEQVIVLIQHLSDSHTETQEDRRLIWLAVAFSHPTWSRELMFSDLAQVLQLEESDLLKLAIICGNQDYLDWLITRVQVDGHWESLFEQNKSELIALAAKHGHIHLLDKLCLLLDDEQAVEGALIAQNYQIVMDAAQYGHVSVLKFFMTHVSLQHCMNAIAVNGYMPYRLAAKEGQVPVLMYFNEWFPQKTKLMFPMFSYEAFSWAACNGHISVLQYWANTTMPVGQLKGLLTQYASSIFLSNLRRYDLQMIQFICKVIGEDELVRRIQHFEPGALLYSVLTDSFVSVQPEAREMLLYLRSLLERHRSGALALSYQAIYLASMSQKAYDVIRYYTTMLSPIELQQVFSRISTARPEKLAAFLREPTPNDVIVFLLSFPEFWTNVVPLHKNNDIVISAILSRAETLRNMANGPGELPLMSEREAKANYFLTCYCNESPNCALNSEVDFLLMIPAVEKEVMQSSSQERLFFPIPQSRSLENRLREKYGSRLSTQTMLTRMQSEGRVLIPAPPSSQNISLRPRSSFMPIHVTPSISTRTSLQEPIPPSLVRPTPVYLNHRVFVTGESIARIAEIEQEDPAGLAMSR